MTEISSYSYFVNSPRSLRDLIDQFHAIEAHQNADEVCHLRSLAMSNTGNVQVPGLGEFALNDWSRRQLANLVGIKWDKWFEKADPAEQAEEINRRFQRYDREVKLRTTRILESEVSADGTLKAFVSPGFTAVDDSKIAQMMHFSMREFESDFRIIRSDITEKSITYAVGIGRPYQVGGPGEVGDVWGGILVRNSGVGYASLSVVLHLTRLTCRNGMTAPLKNAELMRHRHTKGIADDGLFEMLGSRMAEIPGQLRQAGQVMLSANRQVIDDPATTIGAILKNAGLPKHMAETLMIAYEKEPRPTAFGISSAFTRGAQEFSPEERLDLERAASRYLQTLTN